MAGNKQAFIETIRSHLNQIDPGNPSIEVIVGQIDKMDDETLETYVKQLENGISDRPDLSIGRELIPLVVPPLSKTKITISRNIALLKKWGVPLMEQIWMVDPTTGVRYLTGQQYVVLNLPIVRQSQTLEKKIKVAKDNIALDDRTHQAARGSKGASLSSPELQALLSQGLEKTSLELMKFRGGDDLAYRKMVEQLTNHGHFKQDDYQLKTRAKSTDVAAIYLKACHFTTDL